jgi:hypothetical protein
MEGTSIILNILLLLLGGAWGQRPLWHCRSGSRRRTSCSKLRPSLRPLAVRAMADLVPYGVAKASRREEHA